MGAFVGVNGVARKIRNIYVGVDGKAREIKRAYVGDAYGKAQLFYGYNNNMYIYFSFDVPASLYQYNGSIENFDSSNIDDECISYCDKAMFHDITLMHGQEYVIVFEDYYPIIESIYATYEDGTEDGLNYYYYSYDKNEAICFKYDVRITQIAINIK